MKNIHILPTDKPSRLFKLAGDLHLHKECGIDPKRNQHIYITNDEEIKEGDWFYLDMSHSNTLPDEIHQMGNDKWSKTGGIHFCEGNSWVDSCKKIILTTDQDLIKNGIQAIDDEFLEWFVKNPSCERVEVKDVYKTFLEGDKRSVSNFRNKYKIIISKGEPKFITVNIESAIGEDLGKVSYIPLPNVDYIPKQETLEEAIFRIKSENEHYIDEVAFELGAKWQQERSYSDENMRKAFCAGFASNVTSSINDAFEKWFEQFKKK